MTPERSEWIASLKKDDKVFVTHPYGKDLDVGYVHHVTPLQIVLNIPARCFLNPAREFRVVKSTGYIIKSDSYILPYSDEKVQVFALQGKIKDLLKTFTILPDSKEALEEILTVLKKHHPKGK